MCVLTFHPTSRSTRLFTWSIRLYFSLNPHICRSHAQSVLLRFLNKMVRRLYISIKFLDIENVGGDTIGLLPRPELHCTKPNDSRQWILMEKLRRHCTIILFNTISYHIYITFSWTTMWKESLVKQSFTKGPPETAI